MDLYTQTETHNKGLHQPLGNKNSEMNKKIHTIAKESIHLLTLITINVNITICTPFKHGTVSTHSFAYLDLISLL